MTTPTSYRRRRLRLAGALALLATTLLAAPARADDAACVQDAARVCPGVAAKDGQLWACLLRNQFQLSTDCQRAIQDVQRRAGELRADCAPDVYRLCARTPAGEGRVLDCLNTYVGKRELSTNCEQAVVTALEKLQEFVDGCADDINRLCPDVPTGGGRLFLCLRSQSQKLSSRCRQAVTPR